MFEPVEVYASEQEVTVGDFVLKFDTSTGTITGYISGEGHLEIPEKINGVAVKSVGDYAFSGCQELTSINIPNGVTSMGEYAFNVYRGLTSINVDVSNPNYTSVDGVLFSKDLKTLIAYPQGKNEAYTIPSSVTSIGERAFSGCQGLTSITIPNSVSWIGDYAFSGCQGLTSINIPNSVTSIGEWAFSGCQGLTSIYIPNSVTSIESEAFNSCTGLTSINVDSSNPNYTSEDGVLFSKDLKTLLTYPGGKKGAYTIHNSVTSIGDFAFYCCTELTSINIPNSVTSIGYSAFSGCQGLTSINIPNSVTSIESEAFNSCTGLTSINIPNSVTSIGYAMFASCSGLTSISIPSSITSIGTHAFWFCTGLKDIYYSGSQAQWNAIDKPDPYIPKDTTIYYNSTAPSTSSGNSTGSSSPSKQPPSAPKVNGIKFKIGQTTDEMDVAPYVENGNTMIPVRAMATLLGISDDNIVYDDATKKVTITYYERVISLTIGDNKLYVTENGSTDTKTMDNNATAVTKDWRTFVPVRALSEAFGLQVGWDNDTQTVTLSS